MTFYLLLMFVITRLLVHSTNIYQELSMFLAVFHVLGIQQWRAPHKFYSSSEAEAKDKKHINN